MYLSVYVCLNEHDILLEMGEEPEGELEHGGKADEEDGDNSYE